VTSLSQTREQLDVCLSSCLSVSRDRAKTQSGGPLKIVAMENNIAALQNAIEQSSSIIRKNHLFLIASHLISSFIHLPFHQITIRNDIIIATTFRSRAEVPTIVATIAIAVAKNCRTRNGSE
jgi:hypothetical protein